MLGDMPIIGEAEQVKDMKWSLSTPVSFEERSSSVFCQQC